MSILAVGSITMDEFVEELGNVFWGKLTFLKRQDDAPKYGENIQAFNFISNILSPSKQRPDGKERLIKDKPPTNLPIDMKKYIGMTKQAAVKSIYSEKGWPKYTPRSKKSKQSANAMTPSKLKANVEDDELDDLTAQMEAVEIQMKEAVLGDMEKLTALALKKGEIEKAKARREKQIEKQFVNARKKELKRDIKKLQQLIPSQSSKDALKNIELLKAKTGELEKLSQTKREKKMSVNQVAQVMNDALTEAKQDEPEYEELINEELDEFLRTKNSTNDFSVSIAIDKKGNLFCDYDSVNNTIGKKFGTFNRATGKWKLYKSYLKILGTNPQATQAELIKSLTEQHSDEEDGDEDDEEDDKENKPKYEEFDNKELENYFEEKGYRYDLIIDKSGNLYEYNSEFDDSENEGSFEAFGTFDRITGKWEIDEDYEFIISDV
jgi:hypothetical protein